MITNSNSNNIVNILYNLEKKGRGNPPLNAKKIQKKLKNKLKNKKDYNLWRNTTPTKPRNYKNIEESVNLKTQKTYTKKKFENATNKFKREVLYNKIFLGNAKLYMIKCEKWLPISENKLAELLEVSRSTARKVLNTFEVDGLIERKYSGDRHRLCECMKIKLTEKGRKMILAEFFATKKTSKTNNIRKEDYSNNNIIYKSSGFDEKFQKNLKFKSHNDSLCAELWRESVKFGVIKPNEAYDKTKFAVLHKTANILSKTLHVTGKENIISAFKAFLRNQVDYLKKATFWVVFAVKGIYAYIKRLNKQIFTQETEAKQTAFVAVSNTAFTGRNEGLFSINSLLEKFTITRNKSSP